MSTYRLVVLLVSLLISTLAFSQNAENCPSAVTAEGSFDLEALDACFKNEGVLLEVHGIVPMSSLFVVTFRDPQNFFSSVNMSLLGSNSETRAMIKTLKRHDVIKVKGKFDSNIQSPQKHIRAASITLISSSTGAQHSSEYPYESMPTELLEMSSLIGKIHAIHGEGRILVIEYKDSVVPVFVEDQWLSLTRSLYRGDKIQLNYVIQEEPVKPVHLNFDPSVTKPLVVMRSVVAEHGLLRTYTGKLIRFPESPMVKFPVFAIDVDLGDGVKLPHTVLSFTNFELFTKIRKIFQDVWDRHPLTSRRYRNKYVNDAITVTVSGTYNMVDPIQANPQLVVERLEDIVIKEE